MNLQNLRTFDLPQELSFIEALQALADGKCIGIRPGNNTNYVELFRPNWMRTPDDFLLRWHNTKADCDIRTTQYVTPDWKLVVVDHRHLVTLMESAKLEVTEKSEPGGGSA